MLEPFYPCEYVESVFDIDYPRLYGLGYRGIIFDIDNTLVPHGADSTPQVDELLRAIMDLGFRVLLLSDNTPERIERFIRNIDVPYISDAGKPDPAPFLRAVEELGLEKQRVVCVGDQVFSDIRGANTAGIDSILVRYIGYHDPGKKGKKRWLEGVILGFYGRGGRKQSVSAKKGGE